MKNEQTDPLIVRLRKKVLATVAELAASNGNYQAASTALTKNETELSAAQADAAKHAEARGELETLSAVALHRRGLTAEAASAQANELQGLEDSAQQRVVKASEERAGLTQQRSAALSEISTMLDPLNFECRLLTEGEFVGLIASMIDLRDAHVPDLMDGGLFSKTKAHAVYEARKRRIQSSGDKEGDVIALASEIVAEPLVSIQQHEPQLPEATNSVVVRSIIQRLDAEPATPRREVILPPGQTSADLKASGPQASPKAPSQRQV